DEVWLYRVRRMFHSGWNGCSSTALLSTIQGGVRRRQRNTITTTQSQQVVEASYRVVAETIASRVPLSTILRENGVGMSRGRESITLTSGKISLSLIPKKGIIS
ncbi:hypothetical protein PENTCL1PPCAC_11241, partial [Pristionchus entomophagus]